MFEWWVACLDGWMDSCSAHRITTRNEF
jgi:hypothetical protein